MKPQQLNIFHKNLSKLNNAFTHYLFVWTQFSIDYDEDFKKQSEAKTEEIFKNNQYARRHFVKLGSLKEEHVKTNETLIDGIFATIFSYFEEYLKDIFLLAKGIDNRIIELNANGNFNDDFVLIDKVINRIGIDRGVISDEVLDAFTYLRLKRNRLLHRASDNVSKSARELIVNRGTVLNDYWNKAIPKGLHGIDFNSLNNLNEFDIDILIDVLNVFRKISSIFDKIVLSHLGINVFLEVEVLPAFLIQIGRDKTALTDLKIKSRFSGFCRAQYSFELSEQQINVILDDIA